MDLLLTLPILLYFVILLWISLKSRREERFAEQAAETAEDRSQHYFLAGRSVAPWRATMSMLATESSVATLLVFPAAGLFGSLELLWLSAGYIVGRVVVAKLYLPRFYREHHGSLYATMVGDEPLSAQIVSGFYLMAKYISGGVRLYLGGFALAQILGGPILLWIGAVATLVAGYSLTGGLRAVVATDQLQGYLLLALGVVVASILGYAASSGVVENSGAASMLMLPEWRWINLEFSLDNANFFAALFFGGVVVSIGTHGADQDLLQRILAVPDLKSAQRALIHSGFAAMFVIFLYLAIGHLLHMEVDRIAESRSPLIDYIISLEWSLLTGLLIVVMVAASMSTLDSSIHATGAIWQRLLERGGVASGVMSLRLYPTISLFALCGSAAATIYFAEAVDDFLSLAMGSMNFINGGLIAIATMSLFTRRIAAATAVAALFSGFATTLILAHLIAAPFAWPYVTILSATTAVVCATIAMRLETERQISKDGD